MWEQGEHAWGTKPRSIAQQSGTAGGCAEPLLPKGLWPLAQVPPPGSKGPQSEGEDWEEATYISAKGPKEKGGDVVHIPGVTVDPSSLEDTTESPKLGSLWVPVIVTQEEEG